MSKSSSDEDTSDYDSDLEKMANEATDKIKLLLKKNQLNEKKKPSKNIVNKNNQTQNDDSHANDFFVDKQPSRIEDIEQCDNDETKEDHCSTQKSTKGKRLMSKNELGKLSSSLQTGIEISDNYLNKKINKKKNKGMYDELMKKSVLTPDFEKKFALTPYEESVRQQKKERKKQRDKTKGKNWFNMEAPEMTEETKNNLTVLKMRKALDPKRFYKNNDTLALPKYFQFGTVVETAADFYHSRIPKKQRKSNMVEELMADAEFRKYNKRKYVEIQEQKRKAQGPYKHMKRMKKNKR